MTALLPHLVTAAAAAYAVCMAVLLVFGIHLLVLSIKAVRMERQLPGVPPIPSDTAPNLPRVTVQLPLYNEAFVADRLIDAVARLDYPRERLDVQVLDDSTDDTSAVVARSVARWQAAGLRISHVHRGNREGYKAGALQHGLAQSDAPLVAIFDADFVPDADFLTRAVAGFDAPDVGLVQARWGHLNPDYSLLTRVQAMGLDAHFALEQRVRDDAGLMLNFNGTAGVWRRACIDAAGGWSHDTLTEDLDLSYRAQLGGWRLRYVDPIEVPAELPVDMSALRQQQFRWTKGAAETARKLVGPLLRSDATGRRKAYGLLHLTAHIVFPFVLGALLLHPVVTWARWAGMGPGPVYFGLMSLGLVGFAGFGLAQVIAQRHLYPDWPRRLLWLPLYMASTSGMALSNTLALIDAWRGRRTAFVRTPKYRIGSSADASFEGDGFPLIAGSPSGDGALVDVSLSGSGTSGDGAVSVAADTRPTYVRRSSGAVVWAEALVALYALAGLVVVVAAGAWVAVPFQALFAAGFVTLTWWNLKRPPVAAPSG